MAVTASPSGSRGSVRSGALTGLAVVTLLLLFLSSPLPLLWLGWFLDEGPGVAGEEISHRVHEISFGVLFAFVFAGVAAQLRSPEHNLAGMQQAVLAVVVFAAVNLATSETVEPLLLAYVVPVALMVLLHPAGGRLLFRDARPSGTLLVLTAVAALPLLDMATEEADLAQLRVAGHVEHWGAMAAFAMTVLVLALLASLRTPGWRVPAWSVGLAMLVYAGVSSAFPDDASSAEIRSDAWVALAVLWAGLWLFVTVREGTGEARADPPETLPRAEGPLPRPTRPDDRRLIALAVAAIVVLVVGTGGSVLFPVFLLVLLGLGMRRLTRGKSHPILRLGSLVVLGLVAVPTMLIVQLTWTEPSSPVITHAVSADRRDRSACVSCHAPGVRADVVDSPHPERTECMQCHESRGFPEIEGAVAKMPSPHGQVDLSAADVGAVVTYERQRREP